MALYRGTLKWTKEDRYGYIDQTTVEPPIETTDGIFVHGNDCNRPLRVGMELEFGVQPDEKRGKGFFRTPYAHETPESRFAGLANDGVTLGVPEHALLQPSFFVSWCVDAKTAAKIKKQSLEGDALGLLIIQYPLSNSDDRHQSLKERRQIIALNKPMAVLSFNTSGRHRVVGVIVNQWGSQRDLIDRYLNMRDGEYTSNVISSHGDCLTSIKMLGSSCFDIDMPEALFAEKPRDYEWVNSFFKNKPRDECAFRDRRLLVYPFQLVRFPYLGVKAIVKFAVALLGVIVLNLVGMRGINYAPLRHPLKMSPGNVGADVTGSRFIWKMGNRHLIFPFIFSPLTILQVLIVAVLTVGLGALLQLLTAFAIGMLVTGVFFGFVSLVLFWAEGVDWNAKFERLNRKLNESTRAAAKRKCFANEENARRKKLDLEREVQELICETTGPRTPDIRRLKFRPSTIYFYAVALKWKVCRNFSAS